MIRSDVGKAAVAAILTQLFFVSAMALFVYASAAVGAGKAAAIVVGSCCAALTVVCNLLVGERLGITD